MNHEAQKEYCGKGGITWPRIGSLSIFLVFFVLLWFKTRLNEYDFNIKPGITGYMQLFTQRRGEQGGVNGAARLQVAAKQADLADSDPA